MENAASTASLVPRLRIELGFRETARKQRLLPRGLVAFVGWQYHFELFEPRQSCPFGSAQGADLPIESSEPGLKHGKNVLCPRRNRLQALASL